VPSTIDSGQPHESPHQKADKPPTSSQLLEDELELDLENMKIDETIDTSVSKKMLCIVIT